MSFSPLPRAVLSSPVRRLLAFACALSVVILGVGSVAAAQSDSGGPVNEAFTGQAGASLAGASGGHGWSGAWEVSGNSSAARIASNSLSYGSLPTSGNSLEINLSPDSGGVRADRALATPITSGDAWLSYRFRATNVGIGHFFVGLTNSSDSAAGKAWGANFSVHNNRSSVAVEPGETYHIVAKYELDPAGADTVYMWVNPTDSRPSISNAAATLTKEIGALDRIRINAQDHGGGRYVIDEIELTAPASISGRLFIDSDGDGLEEVGDPGLSGRTVELYDDVRFRVVASTTTDRNGDYTFADVAPFRRYAVFFPLAPSGFEFTAANVGLDERVDSDVSRNGRGQTARFGVTSGEVLTDLDAGLRALVTPTAIPVATATPVPTATATPTATAAPTPTAPSVPTPRPGDNGFACVSDAGALAWTDAAAAKYWVYKSTDAGGTYSWIGRTLGSTQFTDPAPTMGARYQVHYQGIARVECTISAEPNEDAGQFRCEANNGVLAWTDADQAKYWIYKSTDGGGTYAWIGRALGGTTFADRSPSAGARYQVHYAGIPRENCSVTNASLPTPTPLAPTATPVPAATSVPTATPTPAGVFSLFSDVQFGGNEQSFDVGIFGGANGFASVGNDSASSLQIDSGYLALVCTRSNASGSCRGFTNEKPDLNSFGLNDDISYVQVRRIGDPFRFAFGADVAQIVSALPEGTEFILAPGIYYSQNIVPKADQIIRCQSGAILDGAGSTSAAFSASRGNAHRVTIDGCEIRNYNQGEYVGAVNARETGDFSIEGRDWLVINNFIHSNGGPGVNLGSGIEVRGNEIANNVQIGISAIGSEALPVVGPKILDNNIHDNNYGPTYESRLAYHEGGIKIVHTTGSLIADNDIHHNKGFGIHLDLGSSSTIIERNKVRNATDARGWVAYMYIELRSHDTIVRNNEVTLATGTYSYDVDNNVHGITTAGSGNVLVENNTITGGVPSGFRYTPLGHYRYGFVGAEQGNNVFRNNTVIKPTTSSGSVGVFGSGETHYFEGNSYSGNVGLRAYAESVGFSAWRSDYGFDVNGSYS